MFGTPVLAAGENKLLHDVEVGGASAELAGTVG